METFHEDVVGTILFCFLACLGALVLAVQLKGWHGLCPYGGRLRRNRSLALAVALFILAYALYFSDPQHRNVRNIEGFMSLVSLVVGALLAVLFLAFLASLSEEIRRWSLSRRYSILRQGESFPALKSIEVKGAGKVLFTEGWSGRKQGLLAVMEPVPASRHLALAIAARFKGRALAFLLPLNSRQSRGLPEENAPFPERVNFIAKALADHTGEVLSGCRVLLVGNASRLFFRHGNLSRKILDGWNPSKVVMLAPPLYSPSGKALTDSLVSNTPLDLLRALPGDGGLDARRLRAFLRLWILAFLLILPVGLMLPFLFRARWWFLSGPVGAAVASFWLSFQVSDPFREEEEPTSRDNFPPALRDLLCGEQNGSSRHVVIIGSEDLAYLDSSAIPAAGEQGGEDQVEVVRAPHLLRGKLFTWPSFTERLEEWIWG